MKLFTKSIGSGAGIIIIFCFLLLSYSVFETLWIKENVIVIESNDIPQAFNGKRIIFVSDIHYGTNFSGYRVRKLIKMMNRQNPDVILMGGDYSYSKKENIKPFFELFKKAHAKYGKFAVLGNHDYFVDPVLTVKLIKETGIHLCDNQSFWLKLNGDSIKIGGVGEIENEPQNLNNTIKDVLPENFCLLLCHQPEYVSKLNTNLIDLTFSGHTHGGQITLFGLWAPVLPTSNGLFSNPKTVDQKYRYGLIRDGNRLSYVSSGIGTRFPHLRLFCRPEYTIFILKKTYR